MNTSLFAIGMKVSRPSVYVEVNEFVPRACPQLRHGSLRLAACCCRSIRGADGGFGFFHPLHLHVSIAWELEN